VKTAKSKFDVIIVDVPTPDGAVEPFLHLGVFPLRSRTPRTGRTAGHRIALGRGDAQPDLKDFLRCIRHTLEEIFPHVVAIPGETIHFFGAAEPGVLTADHACSLNACRTGA